MSNTLYIPNKHDYEQFLKLTNNSSGFKPLGFLMFQENVYILTCMGLTFEQIMNDPLILNMSTEVLKTRAKLCVASHGNPQDFLDYQFMFDNADIYARLMSHEKGLLHQAYIYSSTPVQIKYAGKTVSPNFAFPYNAESHYSFQVMFAQKFPEFNDNLHLFNIRKKYHNLNLTMTDAIKEILPDFVLGTQNEEKAIKTLYDVKSWLGIGLSTLERFIINSKGNFALVDFKEFCKQYQIMKNKYGYTNTQILRAASFNPDLIMAPLSKHEGLEQRLINLNFSQQQFLKHIRNAPSNPSKKYGPKALLKTLLHDVPSLSITQTNYEKNGLLKNLLNFQITNPQDLNLFEFKLFSENCKMLQFFYLFCPHKPESLSKMMLSFNAADTYSKIMASYDGLIDQNHIFLSTNKFEDATGFSEKHIHDLYPYTPEAKSELNKLFDEQYHEINTEINRIKFTSLAKEKE